MGVDTSISEGGATTALLVGVLVFTALKISVCIAHTAAPAIYMMGDSLVDVGNNNYLPLSVAKANFPYNGIDFPTGKPTGRFCNGQNAADFLAKKIGLQTSPPFLSLTAGATPPITGVSFASGGSGILKGTGIIFKQSISLAQQVEYFSVVHDKLVQKLGSSGAQEHLSKSLFAIFIGSNDLFAFYSDGSEVSKQYTQQSYVDVMVSTYNGLLKNLYEFGMRKVVVGGVAAIGCTPIQRTLNETGECNEEINYWATKFNDNLKIMLEDLKSESPDMNYAYFDAYAAMVNVLKNHETYGFTETKEACCGFGGLNANMPCVPIARYCVNRTNHVFWDRYHPSEAVASLFSDIIYSGSQEYIVPMNVEQLLAI